MSLVIVDTRCANLASVDFALRRLGTEPVISNDPRTIESAERVILPGVGSAAAAMSEISSLGLTEVLRGLQQPVLGICLGMQLLTRCSAESRGAKPVECLGVIPTEAKALVKKEALPLPHIGWNATQVDNHPLFEGFDNTSAPYFYFVHNYAAPVSEFSIARCDYGESFAAAIASKNYMGVQFHPERSGEAGARVLKNFLEFIC